MKIMLINIITLGLLFSGESTATYRVEGMMCALNCPKKVNKSLNGVDGIKSYKVDFQTKMATVVYDDKKLAQTKSLRPLLRELIIK